MVLFFSTRNSLDTPSEHSKLTTLHGTIPRRCSVRYKILLYRQHPARNARSSMSKIHAPKCIFGTHLATIACLVRTVHYPRNKLHVCVAAFWSHLVDGNLQNIPKEKIALVKQHHEPVGWRAIRNTALCP